MQNSVLLTVKNVSKSFGPTRALDNVCVKVCRGEIRGLVGENGSGKSTVSSIIAGFQKADSGIMTWKGQEYHPESMLDAMSQGVSMIVQETGTVPNISVADNIFMGKETRFGKFGFINKAKMNAAAKAALARIWITDIDPAASINSLNFEERKLVEIARVMVDEPELLIVDETTTALSHKGRDIIYSLMEEMKSEGKAVLFISHDLDELIKTCNVITVLRDGVIIRDLNQQEMEPDLIKELMVGRVIEGDYYRSDMMQRNTEEVAVSVDNVTVGHTLRNFSMKLYKGEILGIGGLSGCGMHDLGKVMFGAEKCITGTVTAMKSGDVIKTPMDAVRNSFGYVPKNRDTEALVLSGSIADNIMLPSYDQVKSQGLISKKKAKKFVSQQRDIMSIKCASLSQEVQYLSGGNKQKVVFSKWVGTDADILILDSPTRGIDIGVKTDMYQLITKFKNEGKAILMISEELPELIGMCDRILILKNGRLAKEFLRNPDLSESDIIKEMI